MIIRKLSEHASSRNPVQCSLVSQTLESNCHVPGASCFYRLFKVDFISDFKKIHVYIHQDSINIYCMPTVCQTFLILIPKISNLE